MATLAERVTEAVRPAADLDTAAVEVAAGHRQARRSAEEANERATVADAAAEEGLAKLNTAESEQDPMREEPDKLASMVRELREQLSTAQAQAKTVRAEADRTSRRLQDTAGELADARTQIEQFREQWAILRQEVADLVAARAELNKRLTAEAERTEHQRHQAEDAEQQTSRATGQVDYLSGELITAWKQVEQWQSPVAEQPTELAGLRSELTAARAAIEAEKAHGAQRLADQQTRHEETIGELRALLRDQH